MAENESITRLAQPFHFTVKTYAQRYDGKLPFTVETSIHVSLSDIDGLDDPNGPLEVGFKKTVAFYEKMGYSHVAGLQADVKPIKK